MNLIQLLRDKVIIGENGPISRRYVILFEEEYNAVIDALEAAKPKRRGRPPKSETIPHESSRA